MRRSKPPFECRSSVLPFFGNAYFSLGRLPHERLAAYYSAADIFVSGSHREGSGYALIEAMACGAIPCVTDIPSFRAITGGCGALLAGGRRRVTCRGRIRDHAPRSRRSSGGASCTASSATSVGPRLPARPSRHTVALVDARRTSSPS